MACWVDPNLSPNLGSGYLLANVYSDRHILPSFEKLSSSMVIGTLLVLLLQAVLGVLEALFWRYLLHGQGDSPFKRDFAFCSSPFYWESPCWVKRVLPPLTFILCFSWSPASHKTSLGALDNVSSLILGWNETKRKPKSPLFIPKDLTLRGGYGNTHL